MRCSLVPLALAALLVLVVVLACADTDTDTDNIKCRCVYYYNCRNNSLMNKFRNRQGMKCNTDDGQVCCPYKVKQDAPSAEPCGVANPHGFRPRLMQAVHTEFAEFPWTVAVLVDEEDGAGFVFRCGGALLHAQAVLTSAQCALPYRFNKRLQVRAALYDLQDEGQTQPFQERLVHSALIHEHYHSGVRRNDVALLFLDEPLDISDTVRPVCLAPADHTPLDSQSCLVAGWGEGTVATRALMKLSVAVVTHDRCEAMLRTSRLGHNYTLDRTLMCAAGQPGKDTCRGDGGSPLFCLVAGTRNRYQQVGIVSWGLGCADGLPTMYASVPALRAWIDQHMLNRSYSTLSYIL